MLAAVSLAATDPDKLRDSALVAESVFWVSLLVLRERFWERRTLKGRCACPLIRSQVVEKRRLERIVQQFQEARAVSTAKAELRAVSHRDVVFSAGQRLHCLYEVQVHDD